MKCNYVAFGEQNKKSTKDTIENDLIDFDAEKFIYWKDEFTLEYYAYKVIDRTTLLN